MKNEKNIKISDIQKHFTPEIHDSFDLISNLPNQTIGKYAYDLQQSLSEINPDKLKKILDNKEGLIINPLTIFTSDISDIELVDEVFEFHGERHNFSLSFWVNHPNIGVSSCVIIRNGYLLKCLNEALIKDINEIEKYKAELIYENAKVNCGIASFVRFIKK